MSSLTYAGPVKASCLPAGTKGMIFVKVGSWFKDSEGRVVLRLETLPLPHQNWNGYLNIYEAEEKN